MRPVLGSGGRRVAAFAVGAPAPLILWELIGRSHAFGAVWPPLTAVVRTMLEPTGREVLLRAAAATLPQAARGLFAGLVLGSTLALVARIIPALGVGFGQIAVLAQAVPIIAVTPFLLTTMDRAAIPSALAAICVFFASFVSIAAGLSRAPSLYGELFRVLGASRLARLRHLDVPASIPLFLEGLRFAVPGAMVGAIVGEWFQATRGLGVVMLHTMRSGDTQMLLGSALVASLISLAAYGAVATAQRFCRWELT